jgi:hypothetical protein
MNISYDYKELCYKIVSLIGLYTMIYYFPKLKKYNNETRFNYYRSLMCLAFTIIGLHIGINHFMNGFMHPFSFKHNEMYEIQYLFMAYLIIDLLKIIASNKIRFDLLIHHVLCIGNIIFANIIDKYSYLHCMLLVCESISIVTGIDSMAIEDSDTYLSYQCKRFRKNVISKIRLPMWILLFIFSIKYMNKIPSILFYNILISSLIMIGLDLYWEKKCDNIINKFINNIKKNKNKNKIKKIKQFCSKKMEEISNKIMLKKNLYSNVRL